jgi:hypothetical protein
MANTPDEFPIFTKLDSRQITLLCSKFKFYLKDFEFNYGIDNIVTNDSVMVEICERIEKRRVYFHIFYNKCRMGELNEGSLMCFWILKLMPFSHHKIPANELNAKIALYLFYRVLLYIGKKKNRKINLNVSLIGDLYYSFRFRDLSKEAIMALAEGMLYG